jgi:hypothetical protein
MKRPSERVLRRSAWVVTLCLISMLIVRVVIYFTEHQDLGFRWGEAVDAIGLAVIIMLFPVTGALIVRRQPSNTIGWLLQGVGVVWLVGLAADNYARYGLLINPGSLPGAGVANVVNAAIWAPALGLMGTFVVLLYPNGHLPTPGWRPVAWLSGLTILALTATMYVTPGRSDVAVDPNLPNPLGWEAAKEPLKVLMLVLLVLFPVCIIACAVGLVRRFRRSQGVERLQLKWLAAAGAIVACLMFSAIVLPIVTRAVGISDERSKPWFAPLDTLSFLSFALLPAAIGVAILRHGLYEIDAIINRAVVYGFLTVTLAGAYLGSVLLLQFLLPVTRQSDLAVAGSTLAVAALFRPARVRIQHVVDRRFYRSRYDAARTLDEFTGQLRHQVDINAVEAGLRRVVQDTVQPAHVSVWIRP